MFGLQESSISMDPDFDKTVFDTVCFDNDDYYEGQVLNRVPHGEGTMYYSDGRTVAGKWIYGEHVSGTRDERIPGAGGAQNSVFKTEKHVFCVGYDYDNKTISDAFGVSAFIRGNRTHHDNCVLLSMGSGVYQDGIGWEADRDGGCVFIYTGEGLEGDQELTYGNRFLRYSTGKNIYLFVKKKSNCYVFHGKVVVKRTETVDETDKNGKMRKVFKFVLRRV